MTFRLTLKTKPPEEEVYTIFKFLFKIVNNFSDEIDQGITSFNEPNTLASNTLILRFAGQSRNINFDFDLIESDTDLSEGTAGYEDGPVKTTAEQKKWLVSTMFPPHPNDRWELEEVGSNDYLDEKIDVALSNIKIDCVSTDPLKYTGRIEFIEGKNYEDWD